MPQYRLTLTGEALPGHTTESIFAALQQRMGLTPAQAKALLPPATRCLKSGLDARNAERWCNALHDAGLVVTRETEHVAPTPTPTKPPPPPRDSLDLLQRGLANGFGTRRVALLYRLQLTLVTLCCLLIPLLYVALVGAVGYACWWYLSHVHLLVGTRVHGRFPLLLIYGVPGLSGGILLLFLIRPLIFRSSPDNRVWQLEPGEEPRLTKAIGLLATTIGIRPPVAVVFSHEVNASVHFEKGWPGFFTGRKVLTIGLPLVAGLSHQQFLGVLAHEFGHFAQRFGMRCTFLINHVNAWLDQRAHYADPWDDRLDALNEESEHVLVTLTVLLARAGIGMSRALLRGFFSLSFRLSRSLSRQMEFDADRYEILLSGSASFEQTALRLRALSRAFNEMDKKNAGTWREHKLLRNMPAATSTHVDTFDANTWALIRSSIGSGTTRYWDTHPADLDRLHHAQALAAPGIYQDESPASALFDRFDFHCQEITLAYYREMKVDYRNAELCDSSVVAKASQALTSAHDELRRWSGRQWHASPWLPLHLVASAEQRTLAWQACIDVLDQRSPAITSDWEMAGEETKRRMRLALSGMLDQHDVPSHLSRLEPFDEEKHLPEYDRIVRWQTPARLSLIQTAGLYRQRMELAVGAEHPSYKLAFALARIYGDVEALQEAWFVARHFPDDMKAESLVGLERLQDEVRVACRDYALRLLKTCDGIPQNLFEGTSLGAYLRRRCPQIEQPSPSAKTFIDNAGLLIDGLAYAWQAALADLAKECSATERANGIRGLGE